MQVSNKTRVIWVPWLFDGLQTNLFYKPNSCRATSLPKNALQGSINPTCRKPSLCHDTTNPQVSHEKTLLLSIVLGG